MSDQDRSAQDPAGRHDGDDVHHNSHRDDTPTHTATVDTTGGIDPVDIAPDTTPDVAPLHTDVISTGEPVPPARRRGPDPLALLVGLATLAMAVFAFVGELPDLSGFDPRWLLAGGAALVGLALLVGSLRGRRGG